jgi:hypothetical protein
MQVRGDRANIRAICDHFHNASLYWVIALRSFASRLMLRIISHYAALLLSHWFV